MERKSRSQLSKKVNIMNPILTELGTDDDPCFGKGFDGTNQTCRRCGDSELCLIAMGQKNHAKRAKLEKQNSFKDLSEEEFIVDPYKVHSYILKLLEKKKAISPNSVIKKINNQFYKDEGDRADLKILLKKILKQSVDIKLKKIYNKSKIIKNG